MSASGLFKPHRGINDLGVVDFVFKFYTNTASDPDTTLFVGNNVATVTYTSTSRWTVTLDRGVKEIVCLEASILDNATPQGDYASVYIADEAADPLVFTVQAWTDDGVALANTSGRAVMIRGALKLSGV